MRLRMRLTADMDRPAGVELQGAAKSFRTRGGRRRLRDIAEFLPSSWLVQASHVALGGAAWPTMGWIVACAGGHRASLTGHQVVAMAETNPSAVARVRMRSATDGLSNAPSVTPSDTTGPACRQTKHIEALGGAGVVRWPQPR